MDTHALDRNQLRLAFKRLANALLICMVSACSSLMTTDVNEAREKLTQAQQLINEGRPIPAEALALEAHIIFSKSDDQMALARTDFFLGELYKSKAGRQQVPSETLLDESIDYLTAAEKGFKEISEHVQAAKAAFEAGQAFRGKRDFIMACSKFHSAFQLLRSGMGDDKEFEIHNSNFTSPAHMIEAHIQSLCPNSA